VHYENNIVQIKKSSEILSILIDMTDEGKFLKISPWWRGFNGVVEEVSEDCWIARGVCKKS
jgi:hypothetical protein